jgi:hypothetical protein
MLLDFSYKDPHNANVYTFWKLQVLEVQRLFFLFNELLSINYGENRIFCI